MSNAIDRLRGVKSSQAIKVPCRVATTANISLSGEQTIDGVAVVEGDRVLVKNQNTASENGIWEVDTGGWSRAPDWNGPGDIVTGTTVVVTDGSTGAGRWRVITSNPIVVGTTSVEIDSDLPAASVGGSLLLATRSSIIAATVNSSVDVIRTVGRASLFDNGGAVRVRGTAAGVDPIQSLDGAYWEIRDTIIRPEMFGATTASADASATFASAAAAAVSLGVWLEVSEGTWRAAFQLPANLKMRGAGRDRSVIKRPVAYVGTYVISPIGNKNVTVWDLTVHADNDNNANPCNCFPLPGGGNYDVRRVSTIGGQESGGGYGAGIAVYGNTDAADGTRSRYEDCRASGHDKTGILFTDVQALDIINPYAVGGTFGIRVDSIVSPVTEATNIDVVIDNAGAVGASEGCVSIAATYIGTGGVEEIESSAVSKLIVNGAWARDGTLYGVAIQGKFIVASNLHGVGCGHTGVLWNVYRSSCVGIVATDNDVFGLDCGFSKDSTATGLSISENAGTGVSIGATINCAIGGGYVGRNGLNVYVERYDATFTNAWIQVGDDLNLHDLLIECHSGNGGLYVAGGMTGRATNVRVTGATDTQAWTILSDEFRLIDCSRAGEFSEARATAAAATNMVISEALDVHTVTGSAASITMIMTQDQFDYDGKLAWIEITDDGDNYAASTLDLSAGDGSGAVATILPTTTGELGAPRITNHGSLYTADFAITAVGAGSGFTATGHVGIRYRTNGRRLTLHFQGINTLVYGTGNIITATGVDYVTRANEVVNLVNVGGVWIQEAPDYQNITQISYTPVITATTGTITTPGTCTGAYTRVGKLVTGWARLQITTNGTGAGRLLATLPVSAAAVMTCFGSGYAVHSTTLQRTRNETAVTQIDIENNAGTYPGADGADIRISFTYIAA